MENWTREEWREAAANGQVSMQATRKRWGISDDEDVWEWFDRKELLEHGRAHCLPDGYVAVRKDDLESLYADSRRLIADFGETDDDRERQKRIDAILGRKTVIAGGGQNDFPDDPD